MARSENFFEDDRNQNLEIAEAQSNLQKQYESLYRAVVIDAPLADVKVSSSPDGHLNIAYQNTGNAAMKLRYRFYQREEGGIFYAGVEDTGVKGKAGVLSYLGNIGRSLHLSVEIPAGIPMIEISTTSGDIQIKDITLSSSEETVLKLQSDSGDIEGSNLCCDRLTAQVNSGDIELTVDEGIRQIDLTACSGDIDLDLRKTAGASIEINTANGDIEVQGRKISNHDYKDAFGDGSCRVSATAADGDITIL